jgi:hypothetical protein
MAWPQLARLVGIAWVIGVFGMGAALIVNGRLGANRALMIILFFAALPGAMIYRWAKLHWEKKPRPTRNRRR